MKRFWMRFASFVLLLSICTGAFALPRILESRETGTGNVEERHELVVVLDAGHGGEDGGAVSANGVFEKDINLSLAFLLRDLLEANGIRVVLTRETDILLYDKQADFEGRKKVLDLQARREIAEQTENCVFVSLHMNAYPKPQYSGLQVWYSQNHPGSHTLASAIQQQVSTQLQPENHRRIKPATSAIYLLHHLQCPAVLVECGFLSNPTEATLLATSAYQEKLAFLIFLSLTESMEKISGEIVGGS